MDASNIISKLAFLNIGNYQRVTGQLPIKILVLTFMLLTISLATCVPESIDSSMEESLEQTPSPVPTVEMEFEDMTVVEETTVESEAEETRGAVEPTRVRVTLRLPEAGLGIAEELQHIADVQVQILAELTDESYTEIYSFQTAPILILEADAVAQNLLNNHPNVQSVIPEPLYDEVFVESETLLSAKRVWQDFGITGKGVTIALLDTGVAPNHPDLSGTVLISDTVSGADGIEDTHGHGTHVAGMIAGQGSISPRGIAPGAKLVSIKVADEKGRFENVYDVVEGLEWVRSYRNLYDIDLVNISMHLKSFSDPCDDQLDPRLVSAVQNAIDDRLILFAPAGHGGRPDQIAAPACLSDVISVGQTNKDGSLEKKSNESEALDLLAPGIDILSTGLYEDIFTMHGTSHACPHATAVAALMLEADPKLNAQDIDRILKATGYPKQSEKVASRTLVLIDPYEAVSMVLNQQRPPYLELRPADTSVAEGELFSTEVWISGAKEITGVDFSLGFDPEILVPVDPANPDQPARNISPGELLPEQQSRQHRNDVFSDEIHFDYFLLSIAEPINGSGQIATVTWKAMSPGSLDLILTEVLLDNDFGEEIEPDVINAHVEVR
jgi:hypothetical protein